MPVLPRRKRDPEGRRAAIIAAAAELIAEVGVDAITHRLVAARAEVPLGATTQYFATLDDLREAAVELMASHVDEQLQRTREILEAEGVTAKSLAGIVTRALADARMIRTDRAVVTAAINDPKLRALARGWSQQIVGILEPVHGPERARAASIFLDGVIWHSQINDDPLPAHFIESALADILGESDRT